MENWKSPQHLKRGDKVVIVSTARKVSIDEIGYAIDVMKNWGLNVTLGNNLFEIENQFAGSDEKRTADLQNALDDNEVRAVFFARGGYGTVRVIDKIDFTDFVNNPKWLIGFSDITVIHSHVSKNFNIQTLHADMPFNFGKITNEALDTLKNIIFGEEVTYNLTDHKLNRRGDTEGIVVGGNLSVLYSLIGSKSDIDTDGKILFIEDLDEYLYHVDRMMMNMKRSGKLSKLKALLIGGMSDMRDNEVPFGKTAEEIIIDAVKEYNYPVYFNFPSGHIKNNIALAIGSKIKITNINNNIIIKYTDK